MTYNVFSETLNPTQSTNQSVVLFTLLRSTRITKWRNICIIRVWMCSKNQNAGN